MYLEPRERVWWLHMSSYFLLNEIQKLKQMWLFLNVLLCYSVVAY